ncbi:DUF2510 domain-containing protein [Microbacterium sp. M28]|uniref:DUF2510 domain-containing protein n=1 Tax=Microbacterium sp. M28 TaxID=2962064 RepID=UPI0021F4730B|nr:DUF2510 domain-containing protein [Microbacterium sp. M28]UYO96040.1 DUF2510 domain-containing protein [Microbacterium sp. M28]
MPRTATVRELEDIMSTPAGWYDDGSGRQRWWDGAKWTEHFAPEAASAPEAPAAEAPAPAAEASAFTPPAVPSPADSGTSPYAAAPLAGPGARADAAPYTEAPVAAATAGKPKPHVIGWIALGVAALGFLLACIPATVILGLILLPIGLILSIVAFFLKGAKWPAITGLILAVVGGIIGSIVLVGTLIAAGVQAIDEMSDTTVSESPQDDADEDADAGSGEVGSRENPAALGSTISGDEYDVVVNTVTLDATEDILAANPYNEAPAEGTTYALINATVTYKGEDSGYAAMVMFDYVTADGEVVSSTDALVLPPEPALALQEIYTDASATGNVVLQVPVGDDGLLRVTPGILSDEVFVAVQ